MKFKADEFEDLLAYGVIYTLNCRPLGKWWAPVFLKASELPRCLPNPSPLPHSPSHYPNPTHHSKSCFFSKQTKKVICQSNKAWELVCRPELPKVGGWVEESWHSCIGCRFEPYHEQYLNHTASNKNLRHKTITINIRRSCFIPAFFLSSHWKLVVSSIFVIDLSRMKWYG